VAAKQARREDAGGTTSKPAANAIGIYILRTSVPAEQFSASDVVRSYKELAKVERAFRTVKSDDLAIRPIHHRLEDRVCAHVFLCMLA
jgi:transposase